ncbi:MAG: type II toxin-antitoxin system RelE/ParE family toxin [Nocardioides sp.]|nr:type II toxin-antitoxin system RelE/ParE family toxin [Nocardioides sp.]
MTQLRLVFHPAVEDDLASIYDHYEQFDSALPSRFEARLDEQVERIEMFPDSGAFLFGSYRRALVKRFPYMFVYVVREDRIDGLAVVGVRRDPAYIEAKISERADG